MKFIYVKRFSVQHAMPTCLCLVAFGWSPLSAEATVFNGENGTKDYNDL